MGRSLIFTGMYLEKTEIVEYFWNMYEIKMGI